jgi:hypothetical protein
MRLGIAIDSLGEALAREAVAAERAATRAVREETEALQRTLRAQISEAFGPRARGLANAWRAEVFPRTGVSLRAAGLVWSKAPLIIDAFARGAVIRPKGGGRYLAIPTGYNAALGRRGRGERGLRVTPAQMVASRQGFLRPFRSGRGFVWCLPLRQGAPTGRRRRTSLVAGGVAEIGTGHRAGREAWAQGLLAQGLVPMFLLLPEVTLRKRLDVAGTAAIALRRLPERFLAAWQAERGASA